jgi:hypothetical protein
VVAHIRRSPQRRRGADYECFAEQHPGECRRASEYERDHQPYDQHLQLLIGTATASWRPGVLVEAVFALKVVHGEDAFGLTHSRLAFSISGTGD